MKTKQEKQQLKIEKSNFKLTRGTDRFEAQRSKLISHLLSWTAPNWGRVKVVIRKY